MTTNTERRQRIAELQRQLQSDLANLEKKFRADKSALEKQCSANVASIEREIKESRAQEIQGAQEEIWKIIEGSGLSLETVLASLPKVRGSMKPSTVVHRGPDGQTWNGRGRMPQWFRTQQAANVAHHAKQA